MIKSYFLAPNFDTAPPPEGPLHLGSILRSLADFEPLNPKVQAMPAAQLCPVVEKTGFQLSLDRLNSADYNFRAGAFKLLSLGANASIERTKGSNKVLSCQRLETYAFNPTERYIKDAVNDGDVNLFMRSSRFKVPVYMVTGLKVAYDASLATSTTRTVALEADAGLTPPGIPVQLGMGAGFANSHQEGEIWHAPTPIIVAFKVKKIWLDRKGEVKHQGHNKGAAMLDGTPSDREPTFTIRWDDELTLEEVDEMFGKGEEDSQEEGSI